MAFLKAYNSNGFKEDITSASFLTELASPACKTAQMFCLAYEGLLPVDFLLRYNDMKDIGYCANSNCQVSRFVCSTDYWDLFKYRVRQILDFG